MKKLFLILILTVNLVAQKKINVDIDYSRFRFDDSTGYLEIYYGFHQNELKPVKTNNKFLVNGIINVEIKEKGIGKQIVNKSWQVINELDSDLESTGKVLNGVLSFQLYFNIYDCKIKASDANDSSAFDSLSFTVEISPLPEKRISISDIELSSSIKNPYHKSNSFFIKNNYEIIPNPGIIYGENLPVLYFYYELYNLKKFAQTDYLKLIYKLSDYKDHTIYEKTKYLTTANQSIAEVGAINILKFPSGAYSLHIDVLDTVSNNYVYNSKKFFIYNPSVKDTNPQSTQYSKVLSTEFSFMSGDELDEYFKYVKYIASNTEIGEWDNLKTDTGKKQFLKKFWNNKNKENGSENFQSEYSRRIEVANQRYSTFQKKGWKTDRGRVYLKYGEPDEIERNPAQADARPYEIWHYYSIESGVIFIFAELEGYGEYTLIHSTKRGELSDEKWKRKINTE